MVYAILGSLLAAGSSPTLFPAPGFAHFVELLNLNGVAYQTDSGTVVHLDLEDGSQSQYQLESDEYAYRINSFGAIEAQTPGILDYDIASKKRNSYTFGRMVANGEALFMSFSAGILVIVPSGSLYFATSGYNNGFGISSDLGTVVLLTVGLSLPHMIVAWSNEEWVIGRAPIFPRVKGVGFPFVGSRYKDVRFLSSWCVAYIGGVEDADGAAPRLPSESDDYLISAFRMTREERVAQAYLIVTDISEGNSSIVGTVIVPTSGGERVAGGYGRLTVGGNNDMLFIGGVDVIAGIRIDEIIKSHERQVDRKDVGDAARTRIDRMPSPASL